MQKDDNAEHKSLLSDLESIKNFLSEEASLADTAAPAPEKIPILLDAVTSGIPVLNEIVEQHTHAPAWESIPQERKQAPPRAPVQHSTTPLHATTPNTTDTQLKSENERLLDNLIEEYLPILESRLREQLRLRMDWITKQPPKNR